MCHLCVSPVLPVLLVPEAGPEHHPHGREGLCWEVESHGAGAGAGQEQLPPEQQVQLLLKPCQCQGRGTRTAGPLQSSPRLFLPGPQSALPLCPIPAERSWSFSSAPNSAPDPGGRLQEREGDSHPHRIFHFLAGKSRDSWLFDSGGNVGRVWDGKESWGGHSEMDVG